MSKGAKTGEFLVIILGSILGIIYSQIWPDRPFPLDTFITLSIWVGARFAEKIVGPDDTGGKRFWRTSEFWVAVGGVGLTILEVFLPNKLPEFILMLAWGYIGGRPMVKATKHFAVGTGSTTVTKTGPPVYPTGVETSVSVTKPTDAADVPISKD